MCPIKSWFEDLNESDNGLVLLGNNKECKIKWIGSIRIRMPDGVDRLLGQVRYVPELRTNLIYLGTSDSNGYTFKSGNGKMKVIKGMRAQKNNSLYVLEGDTIVGASAVAQTDADKTKLWHLRLGHISERGLLELEKQQLLCGFKLRELEFVNVVSLESLRM